MNAEGCPVCDGRCVYLGEIDFNHSSSEAHAITQVPAGVSIRYLLCRDCGFAFAPEMCKWTLGDFETRVYNSEYTTLDPDHVDRRPRNNAHLLGELFGDEKAKLRHLDYGGGRGLLSSILRGGGWNSESYDPFFDRGTGIDGLGKFDLVTAFEVFEHVPDVNLLASQLAALVGEEGLVFFSTLLSDGHIGGGRALDWWYVGPRSGHVSLYSSRSLEILGGRYGFRFGSMSEAAHIFYRDDRTWATRYINI